MKTLLAAVITAAGAFAAQSASAQAAQGDYNGHHYAYYADIGDFAAAQAGATTAGGYLATITSQGEQDFLHNLVSFGGNGITAYIGGSDAAVEGEWRWLGGPEAGKSFYLANGGTPDIAYSFWDGGEPNNSGDEDALLINWNQGTGQWNDITTTAGYGYIVEFGGAAVPEAATWAMMIGGMGLIGGAVRRRRMAKLAVRFA